MGSKNLHESKTSSQILKMYIGEKSEGEPQHRARGVESSHLQAENSLSKDTIGLTVGCVSPGDAAALENI